MLIILSPAKKLDFKSPIATSNWTKNRFLEEAEEVMNSLKKLSVAQIADIMSLSPALAQLNFTRYRDWQLPFTPENARQAIFAFNGDAYQGLDAKTLSYKSLEFANQHLRILSALYGIINPLDLIQPYRIEMGMKFSFNGHDSLYRFWETKISENLENDIKNQGDNILINLASEEYFKVIDGRLKNVKIIIPVFKEYSEGNYKIVSQKAKRARGLMSRYIIQNQIANPEQLKLFDMEGYFYNDKMSSETNFVFTR